MNAEPFPVVDERPLLRPERRWLLRAWRDPALLPALPPGCVYVFADDERYTLCRDPAHLRGTEPEYLRAMWVSVVSVRHRRITATTWVPSRDPADDFRIRAVFGCVVVRPEAVAELGLTDLQRDLDVRLRLDEQLVELQHRFDVAQIDEVRAAVVRNLGDAYQREPPTVAGMDIEFEGVYVSPPRELRDHHAELRDVIRSWHAADLREASELQRVKHVEELLATPERAQAAAIVREESTTKQAADRAFQERDTQTQRLIEQVDAWTNTDNGKRAPIDRRHLADELFRRLTGEPAPATALAELAHTNGQADPPKDGPDIPPTDRVDGL